MLEAMATRTVFLGTGSYLPEQVVTNAQLASMLDTSDDWIRQRTGIEERRFVDFEHEPMGSSDLATRAARVALEASGVKPEEIDLLIHATLSPDRPFPGDAVLVQAKLGIPAGVPALDLRNQCCGFLYGLAVADAFIRTGNHRRVLLTGAEVHSSGLDFTNRGRDLAVLFGDGGGAAVLGATEDPERGLLAVRLHADGRFADELTCAYPTSAEAPRVTGERLAEGVQYPRMNGRNVFKHAATRMPEVVMECLDAAGVGPRDLRLLVPHQANLRINEMVQARLELRDDQVFNNIQRYGNTTAASIPIALDEAVKAGRLERGDLLCLTAFGAGFTWAAAAVRW
jgi:3-oxoacyl-[acyl-carrier-protein] synthase III